MTIETDLRAAVKRADADSLLLHEIVHGDASETVTTEGGTVKTVAKAIGDVEASVAAAAGTVTDGVADAEAARDAAAAARDAAQASVGGVLVSAADTTPDKLSVKLDPGRGPRGRDRGGRRRRAPGAFRHPASERRRARHPSRSVHLTGPFIRWPGPLSDQRAIRSGDRPTMANQPIFVASYRQDAATLLAERANQAQDLLTPGTNGTRIHAVALANDGDMSALVEFGTYVVVGDDVTVDIAPGTTVDEDPFTVTRSTGAWPELDDGLVLTLSKGSAANRGDTNGTRSRWWRTATPRSPASSCAWPAAPSGPRVRIPTTSWASRAPPRPPR